MGRTPLFRRMLGTLQRDGLGRRQVLQAAGALTAASALGGCADGSGGDTEPSLGTTRSALRAVSADIAIVGAGIAGLACAYEMSRAGNRPTVYEAGSRVGGRIYSMGGAFPSAIDWMGQNIERGAELIDTPHKTMIGYASELGLTLEDVAKPKRNTFYQFRGETISESVMVDEYRVLADAMKSDLRAVGSPTADSFTPADAMYDRMSLAQYLETRAPARIKALLNVAYAIEYGIPTDQMSCLAFLLFAKASKQSKLRLWGNFSDERYHVVGGNQQIPVGLAARLGRSVVYGRKLVAVKKLSDGRVELTFTEGSRTVVVKHDAVVLALPFHLLREVTLDASLNLPPWKRLAIQNAVCGDNAKLMVGFVGQPWVEQGGNGACYSDLPALQCTWEANPSLATTAHGILTDYTGAALARSLSNAQTAAASFLTDLDKMVPGAKARARRNASGNVVCHLEAWPQNPLTRGAYTANALGYFTTIAGNEGKAVGNLYFAGEMTDSFYSWQGFMEGGALSGLRVAGELVRDLG